MLNVIMLAYFYAVLLRAGFIKCCTGPSSLMSRV